MKLAQNLLRARNRSNIPMVVLPHPFEPLPAGEIKKLAAEKFEEIAKAFTTGKLPGAQADSPKQKK